MNQIFIILSIYLKLILKYIYNNFFYYMGYTKVYDLENKKDITLLYHINKYIFKKLFTVEYRYSKLGIAKFIDGVYYRFICYDIFLMDIDNINKEMLSSKKFHDIIKITHMDENNIIKYNLTNAKNNFYDINNTSSLNDMIIFYNLSKISKNIYKKNDKIKVTREYFNTEILEHIVTHELFTLN